MDYSCSLNRGGGLSPYRPSSYQDGRVSVSGFVRVLEVPVKYKVSEDKRAGRNLSYIPTRGSRTRGFTKGPGLCER